MANRAQEKLTKDDLPNLTNILTPVASKSSELGLQLGVKHWVIDNIEEDHSKRCEARLKKIVEERLNQEQPLTWRDLVEALRSPSVRAYELAQQIESQYMMSQPSQSERNSAQQHIAFPLSIQPEHAVQTTHTQSSTAVSQTHQISEQSTKSETLPSLQPPPVVPPPSYPSSVTPQLPQFTPIMGQAPQLPQSSPAVNQTVQVPQPSSQVGYTQVHYHNTMLQPQLSGQIPLAVNQVPSMSSQVGSSQLPQIHYPVMPQPPPQPYPWVGSHYQPNPNPNPFPPHIQNTIPPHPLQQYQPPHPLQQYPPQYLPYFPLPMYQSQYAPPTQSIASVHITPEASSLSSSEPVRPHPQPHLQPNQGEVECSPLVRYIDYVKTVYSKVERATHVVKWPKKFSETYTNLVCIDRHETTGRRKEYDEVTKAMVEHGDVDVVYGKKWPIDFDEIASGACDTDRVVLVEGAPGVGKSTFAWEYCRRWARGEIGQHYQLVLLLTLRDPRMSRARTLSDLIPNPSADMHQAAVKHLESSHGWNTLIILEGFDELPDACRSEESVFLRLISGELLPSATVMVTSRPWATETIIKNYSLFQHIEILGFTSEQIVSHIRSVLPEDESKDLETYISNHPQIRGCMYIPLNTVIVLSVFKERQASMPTTLTELYTAVVQTLLVRYLEGHADLEKCSKCIIHKDLFKSLSIPHNTCTCIVKRNFLELCQLAYKGIIGKADESDLPSKGRGQVQLIFEESDLPEDFDNLGFMDSVTELYVTRGAVSSYNFLHLTFQEFFAAIHISTMSPAEQVKHFQQHHDGKLKVVLRFLAGISKLKCLMSETVRDTFVTSETTERGKYHLKCDAAVGVDLVNWMFEAQSDRVIASLIKEKLIEFKNYHSMLPMDYYSLGYCVVHSQCDWVLRLNFDKIEDSEMLVAGASHRPDTNGRVVGLHTFSIDNDHDGELPGFLATLLVGLKDILHLHELSMVPSTQLNHIPWSDLSSLRVLGLLVVDTILGLDKIIATLSLESLVIVYEQLHNEDCVALGRAASTLKELKLCGNTEEQELEVITKALVSNLSLDTLDLTCNCSYTDTAVDCLVQFITNSTTLECLGLHQCMFTVPQLRVLAQATHNPTVQTRTIKGFLFVVLNNERDINELDEVFRVYPHIRNMYGGVAKNSTLEEEEVPQRLKVPSSTSKQLAAYPDARDNLNAMFPCNMF